MRYRLFQYALPAPPELADLNEYINSQRVASVTHHFVNTSGGGGMLLFVVESVGIANTVSKMPPEQKVDYREQLSAGEFATFSRLRDQRKKWADALGVPVYTLFTNAQLAQMVKQRVANPSQLSKIEGVGPSRVEKYGGEIIRTISDLGGEANPQELTP